MSELRSIVAEIERIRDAKKDLAKDEARQFAAAKASDIDGKALRTVLKRRAMGSVAAQEFDDLVTMYESALGGKAVARDAMLAGASVREAAKKAGIGYGTARRAKTQVMAHDRETGEITESGAGVASPQSNAAGPDSSSAPLPAPEPAPDDDRWLTADDLRARVAGKPDDGDEGVEHTDRFNRTVTVYPAGPEPDPDAGWEKRDGEATFMLGERIRGGKEPVPDDLETPAFLRVGTDENRRLRGGR